MKFPILNRSPLFSGLTESEIETVIESVNYRSRFYHAGAVAVVAGEEISSVMIVLSGSVRGEMTDLTGKTIKIEDVHPPQALAAAFIYGREARYPVNVIANSDAELLIIGKAEFLTLMNNDRRLLLNYLTAVCTRALFLSDRLRFLSFRTIREKYAHYISSLPGAISGRVVINRTQQELADYFGVTRPSLARAVSEMESDGLISVDRRKVRILDIMRLSTLSET
ncbi:MAG: Crp/Fnr family transcriptional regulator [Bacteroidales bacterium]|nr:Crp/Fnr family transcriptional regulator [Bacteroidales bacterium]MDT8372520.1 Crp/Fnr family transcriptional regulator [Bacteroidales bacterium]